MKSLVVSEPNTIALRDRDAPTAVDGEVVIRPTLVGICGTDLEILDGSIDEDFVTYPVTIGHEWTGVVTEADHGTSVPVGSRVVGEGIVPCGHCRECAAGNTNRCRIYDEFGFTRHGAMSELLAIPARLAHPIAPEVSDQSAVLVEPAAVVLRALWRAWPQPGQRVLVIGDGTIGLLAARLIRLWTPASVTMAGRRPEQAALASAAGVDDFDAGSSPEVGAFDLVIEAAGSQKSVHSALSAVARGGTVLLIGYPGTDKSVPIVVDDIVNGDTLIVGSFSYTRTAWQHIVDLLNSGRLDLGFLVTHTFPLDQWEKALTLVRAPTEPRAKITVMPNDAPDPE